MKAESGRAKAQTGCEENLQTVGDVSETQTGNGEKSGRRQIPGSTAFVPAVAGLIIAGEVIRDLAGFPR